MSKQKRQNICTLTDMDVMKIGSVIEEVVGKDVRMIKQELLGPPPHQDGGLKRSVAEAWKKINTHTSWRNYISGVFAVIVALAFIFGSMLFNKLDDVLTTVERVKAQQSQQQIQK